MGEHSLGINQQEHLEVQHSRYQIVPIDYVVGFLHVGFIAQELNKFVHPVLNEGHLQQNCVYDLKLRAWAKIGAVYDFPSNLLR